jgi:hypothetical protein
LVSIRSATRPTHNPSIRQELSLEVRKRYSELIAKRDAETLTPTEYDELLRLTDDVENWQAQRLGYLAELADLREMPFRALVKQLGIKPYDA